MSGGGGGRAGRGATADAPAADAGRPGTTPAGGARAAQRKDRLYQWLPPFDDASRKVLYENTHAHDRRPLLARHAGRCSSPSAPGRTRIEYAVYLADTDEDATRWRAIAPTTSTPTRARSSSTRGGGGGGARPAAGGGRGGGGGGGGPVQLSADGSSVFFQGTTYDKNPNEVGPKTLHRQGRDQDRREAAHLRERQQQRLRARLDGHRRRRRRSSSSRARARPTCRSSSSSTAARRIAADEEPGSARRT